MDSDLDPIYEAAGREWNVDPQLLKAQGLVESSGNVATPDSSAGAQGVAQIMPATGKSLGVNNPYDPAQAIFAQAKLMRQHLDQFKSVPDALRAYQAGPDPAKWGGPQNAAYVPKIAAAYQGLAPKQPAAAPVAAASSAPTDYATMHPDDFFAATGGAPAPTRPGDDYSAMHPDDFFAATTGAPKGAAAAAPAAAAAAPASEGGMAGAVNYASGLLGSAAHGLSMGLDAPVSALERKAASWITGDPKLAQPAPYERLQGQFEAAHPIASDVATAVGSAPTYMLGDAALAPVTSVAGSGFVPSVVNGAGTLARNALLGGASSYALSGGDPTAAETGAVLGAAAPVAFGAAKYLTNVGKAGLRLALPTEGNTNALANAVIDKMAGGPLAPDTTAYIPGSQPTLAESVRNPSVAGLQNALADTDESARNLLLARRDANAAARGAALTSATGDQADLLSAMMNRDTIKPDFTNKQAVNPQPIIDEINNTLSGSGGNRSAVQSVMNKLKGKIVDGNGNPLPQAGDPEYLYNTVRKEVGDILDKNPMEDSSGKQAASELMNLKAKIDPVIESGAPGFQQYLSDYANASQPVNAMAWLQKLNLTDTEGKPVLSKIDAALKNLDKQTSVTASGANDAQSVTAQQRAALEAVRDDMRRAGNVNLAKSVGSNTVRNAATNYALSQALPGPAGLVGHFLDPRFVGFGIGTMTGHGAMADAAGYGVGQLVKSFGDMRNAQVRNRLASVMLDPSLYNPSTAGNPLLAKLQPYATPVGVVGGATMLQPQGKPATP